MSLVRGRFFVHLTVVRPAVIDQVHQLAVARAQQNLSEGLAKEVDAKADEPKDAAEAADVSYLGCDAGHAPSVLLADVREMVREAKALEASHD